MTRRTKHVDRGYAPPYPKYTGEEVCAQIGWELYFTETWQYGETEMLKMLCEKCPILDECREWALHRERWGFWAGMGETERQRVRIAEGIVVNEPQYTIMPRMEVRDGDSAA